MSPAPRLRLDLGRRPAPREVGSPRHNLPASLSSFVGRERQRAEIAAELTNVRLLTLTGPGGVGKTRLAVEIARELMPGFPQGVWLVELAALADQALVVDAVAAALGLREVASKPLLETLIDHLQYARTLLLLDNCEHVTQASAHLLGVLLRACPGLAVLATSREPLGLDGEVIWPVPPLELPGLELVPTSKAFAHSEAVRLFVERARQSTQGFNVSGQSAVIVGEICRQLDGLPLALELAAARVRGLGIEGIAARLSDRFALLKTNASAAPSRHQTLRAAIDWSYELLGADERRVLERLAVFAGGWTLEAAEAICSSDTVAPTHVLDILGALVDKSFVLTEPDEAGRIRYGQLETLRQYGLERLKQRAESDAVAKRHATFFTGIAQRMAAAWLGPVEGAWWGRAESEQDNLRSALRWLIDHNDVAGAQRLMAAAWRLWRSNGRLTEARTWIAATLAPREHGGDDPAPRAELLKASGVLAQWQGDFTLAQTYLEAALAHAHDLNDVVQVAWCLVELSELADMRGDRLAARALLEKGLVTSRSAGVRQAEAASLYGLGYLSLEAGDHHAARRLAEEGLSTARAIGSTRLIALLLQFVGEVHVRTGDTRLAREALEQSVAEYHQLGDATSGAGAVNLLGMVETDEGNFVRASALFADCLAVRHKAGHREGIACTLEGCARLALAQGSAERAARLLGAEDAVRESIGAPLSVVGLAVHDRMLHRAATGLRREALDAAFETGRAMRADEAVAYALQGLSLVPVATVQQAGHNLTRREREVAILIQCGRNNREIAESLVIQPSTAERHVANILRKLGCRSRTEVAMWAVEHAITNAPAQ